MITYQFALNAGIIGLSIVSQFLNNSNDFLSFSYSTILVFSYMCIVFNALYISSVSLSLIVNITQHFIQIYSYIIYSLCFIIFWIYISLTIFNPIKIKGCFIGACASESNTKILLNFIPYSIEGIFGIMFTLLGFISLFIIKDEKIKKKKYVKAFLFEFCYIAINFSNSFIKFWKEKNNSGDRFDEYGSIHDFIVIIRTLLMVMFTLEIVDLEEWVKLCKQSCENSDKFVKKENEEVDKAVKTIICLIPKTEENLNNQ